MDNDFRNAVKMLYKSDVVIEILDHQLIVSTRKPASIATAKQLAEFITAIASHYR